MYVFGSGRCEWMRELGLGFTNHLGTGGVLDMCLCFGCGGVGGVGCCCCCLPRPGPSSSQSRFPLSR